MRFSIAMVILLLVLPEFAFSQKMGISDSQNKADSLSSCGYFKEEIVYRKIVISALEKNSGARKIAELYLRIAEHNQLTSALEYEKGSKVYKEILAIYAGESKDVQQALSLEVNRLKASYLSDEEKKDEAIILYKYLLKKVNKNSIKEAELFLNIAQTNAGRFNYFEAITYFKKAITGFEKNGMKNHYACALAYNDLAMAYDYANVEKDMLPSFEKALDIWSTYYKDDIAINATGYNDYLFAAIEYGDRQKAAEYQKAFEKYMANYLKPKQSLSFVEKKPFDILNAKCLFYLSSIRYYEFEFNEAELLENLNAQIKLFDTAPKAWKEKQYNVLLSSYDSASYAFYMNEQSERSLAYNQTLEKLSNSDFYTMKVSANRAMLYYYKHDYESSLVHNQKALDFLELLGYKSSYLTLLALKAENLANLGKREEAIKTLKLLYETQFDKNIPLHKITASDFGEVNNSSYINILIHSGIAYRKLYEQSGKQKKDLLVLKNFYGLAAQLFQNYYQKGLFNPSLERQLNNIKEGLLYSAIQSPDDKGFLANSINSIENASSQHLWKQFMSKYSDNLNLPKSIIAKRNEAQIELSYLEKKETPTASDSLRIIELNQSIANIEQDISKKYPTYNRFQSADFQLSHFQSQLNDNQMVLKYLVTDSSIFVCKITKTDLSASYLGKRSEIENSCQTFYNQVSSINFGFENQAKLIFKKLIEPLALSKETKVVFVTENFLSYLPFESLLSKDSQPLAMSNSVSYAYSLKLLEVTNKKSDLRFSDLLTGFAPKYKDDIGVTRSEGGQLIYTGKELEKIASILGGSSIFLNEKATKGNFINSLGNSRIHHLAMHSLVNEKDYEYSSLLFQNNEKLHFYELYALNFPSEMVVLSACNTGVGSYANGEGLMSISRALNYAGVKSMVHSLWQVPDKETAELMGYFYEFLKDGLSKNDALSEAKRKFLVTNPIKSHPYYWAGFVVNGDTSPVSTTNNWWWIAAVFTMIAVFFIARKVVK